MQENACFQLSMPIGHENKEQMTATMELADSLGAKRLFACVDKNSVYFKQIAQSLATIGFGVTEPFIGLTGFTWFVFEL